METKICSLHVHVHEICHFVPNTYNIWNIIHVIQSVFIDNHPTNTFNPQTFKDIC